MRLFGHGLGDQLRRSHAHFLPIQSIDHKIIILLMKNKEKQESSTFNSELRKSTILIPWKLEFGFVLEALPLSLPESSSGYIFVLRTRISPYFLLLHLIYFISNIQKSD